MNNNDNRPFAAVEAILEKFAADAERRNAEAEREAERRNAEFERKNAEFDRKLEQSRIKFEQEMKESRDDFDRRMKKLEELTGSSANNHGSFAEEYFFNSFQQGRHNFFGEEFEEIDKKVKGIKKGFRDEYDILLMNGKSVGIVEVKYKAHENDVLKALKKANTFRVNFPEYKNHRVYIGLASMAFYPELEEKCKTNGVAIVKQAGDTVVIYDEHLKAF